MSVNLNQPANISADERALIAERKATCPFIGSAVAQGLLAVLNNADNPLAGIEEVRRLGNAGGGDLGDVLVLFASGNHAFMMGESGKLDRTAPAGLFSLEFPGSQGSHAGHSGILEADPKTPGSGRLSQADFARLTDRARDGWISRSDVGRFIAENLITDPHSRVFDTNTAALLATDSLQFVETAGAALMSKLFGSGEEASKAHRETEEKLTKLLGADNLVGSSGEFGLLVSFLVNKPGTRKVDGEPAVAVEDLTAMFVDKRLPDGWETWKKTRLDWVINTTGLLISAGKEYWNLKKSR
ncbi:MAG TPA: hypothetical protein VFE61_00420 [Candidatus Sulfotelmatobacter sp.]|jgi:hypothetical protein|nr:hypothetical protein [Candidatus Sulfotelmatobacter sp.]